MIDPVERIGLFGGSFDPVHAGHLLVAQAACEEMRLSRLFFIPAAQSPFKPGSDPAPADLRLAMLRLALAGWTHFEVDDQEARRGGVSYTIDTVRRYAARYPHARLFYLVGADHVDKLPQWREAQALAQAAQFVVMARPGEEASQPPAPFVAHLLTGFPLALSSSTIRGRVRAGLSLGELVPAPVAEFIRNNQLYLQATSP
jgi:nicotinate-nucleotide adenylyltransferase